jgi:hypothetical protein
MVSLTTVYIVSVLLTSIASFGSAFAGKRFVGGRQLIPIAPSDSDIIDKELAVYISDTSLRNLIVGIIVFPVTFPQKLFNDAEEWEVKTKPIFETTFDPRISDIITIVRDKAGEMKRVLDGEQYLNKDNPIRDFGDTKSIVKRILVSLKRPTALTSSLSEEDVPNKPVPSAPLSEEDVPNKPVPSAPLSEEDNPSQVAGRISSFQH